MLGERFGAPAWLGDLVPRMLSRSRAARPQSMEEVADCLRPQKVEAAIAAPDGSSRHALGERPGLLDVGPPAGAARRGIGFASSGRA